MTTAPYTARVIDLAKSRGMTVTEHAPYGSTYELELRGCGWLGGLVIGKRSGHIVRSVFLDEHNREHKAEGALNSRALILRIGI